VCDNDDDDDDDDDDEDDDGDKTISIVFLSLSLSSRMQVLLLGNIFYFSSWVMFYSCLPGATFGIKAVMVC
jgi:hypothetical protein